MQTALAPRSALFALREIVQPKLHGFLVAAVIAAAAQFLSDHYGAPAMLMALLLGIAFHFLAEDGPCKPGIEFTARSVLRFGGHLFKVGDRIELYGIRGEVIDHGLFSTTIMELSPREQGSMGTARTVMLPNSMLLAGPVRVEPQPRHFAPHRFTLTMEAPVPASETARLVTETAERVLSADRELAARFHQFVARKAGTEIAGPQTSVTVGTSEIGKLQFHVMIYCLVKDAPALQQEITLALFDAMEKRSGKMRDGEAKAWSEIARQLKEGAATKREAA